MVLNELGSKISSALNKLKANESVIDDAVFNQLLKDIAVALLQSDVKPSLIKTLREKIRNGVNLESVAAGLSRKKIIEQTVVQELTNLVDPGKKPWRPKKGKFNVVMFVGLQGAGKTTTCSKLALYYKDRKGFKVGLVCADTYRAGAFEQLRMNASRVKVPFYGDTQCSDPAQIAKEGLDTFKEQKFDLVIVDTSGRHKQEAALFEEMTAIHEAITPDETIFVMDSSIGQAAYDQAKAFHDAVEVGSVILTKLDGHAKGGGALSAVAATQSPITFIGVGEQLTDLKEFQADRFVNQILGKGDIQGLKERFQDANIQDDSQQIIDDIIKGKFTLRSMRDQFNNVLKLGPVNSVLQMIPGFSNLGAEHGDESQKQIKFFITILDSMTDEELDGDIKLIAKNQKRQRRICEGCGLRIPHLQRLLEMYQQFHGVAQKMSKMKLKPGGIPQNPAELANMIPPQVLKQIGGPAGLRNMMKQFDGGNLDMGKLQSMMKNMGMGGKSMKMKPRRR